MSFNVSFGSQPNLHSGEKRFHDKGRQPRQEGDQGSKPKEFQPRGRGRGGGRGRYQHRGGRRGGRGGNQQDGNDGGGDDDGGEENEDSDGASSASSETRGRRQRVGQRGRGRGGNPDDNQQSRGGNQHNRGGNQHNRGGGHEQGERKEQGSANRGKGRPPSGRGGRGGERLSRAHSQEHISQSHTEHHSTCDCCQHKHAQYPTAPSPSHPPPLYPAGSHNAPSPYNQPYPQQAPVSQPYQPMGPQYPAVNQPYHSQPTYTQPYGGMPPASQPLYGHPPPGQPPFSQTGHYPGQQPGLMPAPGYGPPPNQPPLQGQYHQPYGQPPYGSNPQPLQGHYHPPQERPTPHYSSSSSINQPTNETAERPHGKEDGKKGRRGPKPPNKATGEENPQPKKGDNFRSEKLQEAKQDPPTASTVDISPDEWVKVFNLLLRKFHGRTKFGTLMTQKEDTLKGIGHKDSAQWIRENPSKFLAFEKDGVMKYVSIHFKGSRLCFNYTRPGTEVCKNPDCSYFHICKDFVIGNCAFGDKCGFNHSFHTKGNGKICQEAGLGMFTDDQIRMIVLCSTPVVCEKFNKLGCSDECCPDIHVCAKYVLQNCLSGDDCKFGHNVKDPEHNTWVLRTFHTEKLPERVLTKILIVKKEMNQGADAAPKLFADTSGASDKPKRTKKSQNLTQSKENLLQSTDLSVGTDSAPKDPGEVKQRRASESEARPKQKDRGQRPTPPTKERRHVPEKPAEGGDGQSGFTASQCTHLCESYTWTGECSGGYLCPRYHHRDRPAYVWQLQAYGDWQDFSPDDCLDIEQQFCSLASQAIFEVVLDTVGGLKLSIHFDTMMAVIDEAAGTAGLDSKQSLKIRRWSTPSYVEAEGSTPLNYYTQWCWYQSEGDAAIQPFRPALFQYTLEEKYCGGQVKFYYEQGDRQLMIHLQEMVQVDLDRGVGDGIFRRPIFYHRGMSAPEMSSHLLDTPPPPLSHPAPPHWSKVNLLHDFEIVELETSGAEYKEVSQQFHRTLSDSRASILRIFRVQNLGLWDKYCSMKRSMTPRDGSEIDVNEMRLFHGTPALLAARGICANNMDFRRSGDNVGVLYGKGSYFSKNAVYSHSYTQGPSRYMFLAKVLVGKYTLGKPEYKSPPPREGLKLYDSCVDNEANPTIFVIFDLAQSYPEYLIQYEDAGGQGQGTTKPTSVGSHSAAAGVGSNPQPQERNVQSVASAHPAVPPRKPAVPPRKPAAPVPPPSAVHYDARREGFEVLTSERVVHAVQERTRSPYSGHVGLRFDNPYEYGPGAPGVPGSGVNPRATTQPQMPRRAPQASDEKEARGKKASEDKCVIS